MSERVQRAEFYGKEFREPVVGGWGAWELGSIRSFSFPPSARLFRRNESDYSLVVIVGVIVFAVVLPLVACGIGLHYFFVVVSSFRSWLFGLLLLLLSSLLDP